MTPRIEKDKRGIEMSAADQFGTDTAAVTGEVERAIHLFFRHLDDNDYEALTALMTADGLWHRQGKELRGRPMVMEAMQARPLGLVTRHIVSNLLVEATDRNHADASVYLTVFAHTADPAAKPPYPMALPNLLAVYRIELLRQAERWYLRQIASTPIFRRA
jgi:SnoaL-like domain